MREEQDENFSCGTGLVRRDDDQDELRGDGGTGDQLLCLGLKSVSVAAICETAVRW